MDRIFVVGNSGSGKSWLAERLAKRLCVPSVHLDNLHWLPNFAGERPRDERDRLVTVTAGMTEEQVSSLEFQFRVNYAMESVSKTRANVHFVKPENAEGVEPHNIVAKRVISDDDYPLKPGEVVKQVARKTKRHFTSHTHQQAMRFFNVRPKRGAVQPENTDRTHCIFNKVFKAYSYSPEWVEKLVAAVNDDATYAQIRALKR